MESAQCLKVNPLKPERKETRRRNRYLTLLIVVLVFVLLPASFITKVRFDSDFYRYNRIVMSMSESDVIRVLEREPSLVIKIGTCRCLYFEGRDFAAGTVNPVDPLKEVACLSELPWFYAAIEVLLDKESRVLAYTWAGEETKIYTISGNLDGSALREIPAKFSVQHCAACETRP
jgi:hypothetical protein